MNKIEVGGRRCGKTTRAIQRAPQGAIYVWCNDRIEYAKVLALKLGRADLKIVPPVWLAEHGNVKGFGRETKFVIDHAFSAGWFDQNTRDALLYLEGRGQLVWE